MCGIIGYVGGAPAAPMLVKALKRLEYRGYDSAGVATISGDGLEIRKDEGKIDPIEERLILSEMSGSTGIGHTRWATHGVPNKRNAHPHTGCKDEIAVVHNGIIENYAEQREALKKRGHVFTSDTDTEVIAHLIEELSEIPLEDAVAKALQYLKGSYALAVISKKEPGKIVVARNRSPLVIGLGDGENYIASDIPAFLDKTKTTVILEDGEIGIIKADELIFKNAETGEILTKEFQEVKWDVEAAEKGGYPHFAIKEINEIPGAVEKTLAAREDIQKICSEIKDFKKIVFVACGTSNHAALIGKYLFEKLSGKSVQAVLASEFSYSMENVVDKDTLVIAISQSGETADTLSAVRSAKGRGASVLSLVNVLGSSLDRESDFSLYTSAGPEIAVIATKTFVTQLVVLYTIALSLAGKDTKVLENLPTLLQVTLDNSEITVKHVAEKIKDKKDVYFIGRGLAYPLVLEGALKLKEISYIHAEGMPAGELKHGTLSLIEEGVPVVASIMPEAYEKTLSNIEEIRARKGYLIGITDEEDTKSEKLLDSIIKVPVTNSILYPILHAIPMQLLAYYTTVERGLDPDKPRNLAKCVTVE